MERKKLIRFIRKNNRFYARADLSFYTYEQLRAIHDRIVHAKHLKQAS
jgi:hypothetical protein